MDSNELLEGESESAAEQPCCVDRSVRRTGAV